MVSLTQRSLRSIGQSGPAAFDFHHDLAERFKACDFTADLASYVVGSSRPSGPSSLFRAGKKLVPPSLIEGRKASHVNWNIP